MRNPHRRHADAPAAPIRAGPGRNGLSGGRIHAPQENAQPGAIADLWEIAGNADPFVAANL
jgi:hypothetical protein